MLMNQNLIHEWLCINSDCLEEINPEEFCATASCPSPGQASGSYC